MINDPSQYVGLIFALAAGVLIATASGQCVPDWEPMNQSFGTSSAAATSFCVVEQRCLYAGMRHNGGGSILQWGVASSAWAEVGGGVHGGVHAIAYGDVGESDSLYVFGDFTSVGSSPVAAQNIARWDGSTWHALGAVNWSAVDPPFFNALALFDDGKGTRLFAGGRFLAEGEVDVNVAVKAWDGNDWIDESDGLEELDIVWGLRVIDIGNGPALYAVGEFFETGTMQSTQFAIAKWNGSSWSRFGPLDEAAEYGTRALEAWDDGSGIAIYVVGGFEEVNGVSGTQGIAKWDGLNWSDVGGGFASLPNGLSLSVYDDGTGEALYSNTAISGVSIFARWDGQSWESVSDVVGGAGVMAVFDEHTGSGPKLVVGGSFTSGGLSKVAAWGGCAPGSCYADFNGDGVLDFFDTLSFLAAISAADTSADLNCDGELSFFDIQRFLNLFAEGCG